MKEFILEIFNKFNSLISIAIAFLSSIFGIQWRLFAAYLLLNIIDYITGIIKARKNKEESSNIRIKGI